MISPTGEKDGTTAWAADLEDGIRLRLGRRVRGFRILREEGGLVLLGRVSTYYDKQMVQQAILEMCQLPIAANRLTVEG